MIKRDCAGIIISFIGIDGSGKSTCSKYLFQLLQDKHKVKYFYLGSPRTFITKLIFRILIKNRRKKTLGAEHQSAQPIINKKISFLSLLNTYYKTIGNYMNARRLERKIVRIKKLCEKGYTIITDRYPQNEYPFVNDGKKIELNNTVRRSHFLYRLYKREQQIFQKIETISPTIVFKLHVDAQTAAMRKPNTKTTNQLKKKVLSLTKLKFTHSHVIDIDANDDIEEVKGKITTVMQSLNHFK